MGYVVNRYKTMKIGKPTHYRPSDKKITACGLVVDDIRMAYDARDCDCINCMNTRKYKVYVGKRHLVID